MNNELVFNYSKIILLYVYSYKKKSSSSIKYHLYQLLDEDMSNSFPRFSILSNSHPIHSTLFFILPHLIYLTIVNVFLNALNTYCILLKMKNYSTFVSQTYKNIFQFPSLKKSWLRPCNPSTSDRFPRFIFNRIINDNII